MDAKKTLIDIGFFTNEENIYDKYFPLDDEFSIHIHVKVDCDVISYRVSIEYYEEDGQIVVAKGCSYAKTDDALENLFVNDIPYQAKVMMTSLSNSFTKIGEYFKKKSIASLENHS